MATRIITSEDFKNFRNVSKKLNTDKIDECINLAQTVDLQDKLGDFYFDVLDNKDSATYADLMTGCTFTVGGESFTHEGIQSYLADLAYSRFLYVINTNQTPFGIVQKVTDDSQPLERNMIKDLVKQAQIDASIKFRIIDKYLKENASVFTRYKSGGTNDINTFSQYFWVKE